MNLIDRLSMTDADWASLPGGTTEGSWLIRRTTKLALGASLANDLIELAAELKRRDAIYICSADILNDFPKAAYWYVCLAGLPLKTLGNIKQAPRSFGLSVSAKSIVERLWIGKKYSHKERDAFSRWINNDLDRIYPEDSRSFERASFIVAMTAGGRALGQSQNVGGDEAVTTCKNELVGALNELNYHVQIVSPENRKWTDFSPDHAIADQLHIRVPGLAVFQFLPGGNRPDMVVYPDDQLMDGTFKEPHLPSHTDVGIIAVGEIKGRLDLSNAWESWMPQVAAHMQQWSDEYPNAARLFLGTLLSNEMVGLSNQSSRQTLTSIYAENAKDGRRRLTAAHNIAKVADRDRVSATRFNNLVKEICTP